MTVRISPPRGATRPSASVERSQQVFSWPAPSGGLMANGSIAFSQPGAAYLLDNWYCTATGIQMRRGKLRFSTVGNEIVTLLTGTVAIDETVEVVGAATAFESELEPGDTIRIDGVDYVVDEIASDTALTVTVATHDTASGLDASLITYDYKPVQGLFSYLANNGQFLFAANEDYIYRIGTPNVPVHPNTNGKWIAIQTQSSSGDAYLVGVNGTDDSFVFDGTDFYPQVPGGIYELDYDGGTVDFQVGETLTGGSSGASGTIYRINPSSATDGTLWLTDVTGTPFTNDEAITDSDGGAAVADGTGSAVPLTDLSFDSAPSLTSADLSYVWSHANRRFYIQKGTLDAWYGPAGQIAGQLTRLPLGGEFKLGGHLVMGATWSRDTGSGLNAMCAFFSSEGEVAVYQGTNPASISTWGLVGVYRIGKPLGPKSIMEAGGDLVIATDVGFVQLSRALDTDFSILANDAVSGNISDLWNEEVDFRRTGEWSVAFWSRKQKAVVALPIINDQPAKWLVANAKTRAWSTYSNWSATCVHVFNDQLFFGDETGAVFAAEQSGLDDGLTYTATCLPMFDQMGAPGYKTVSMLRAVFRGPHAVRDKLTARADYDTRLPPPPPSMAVIGDSTWGDAEWDFSDWAVAGNEKRIFQQWRAAYAGGEVHAPLLQVTSGSNVPLDVELIRIDGTFVGGEVVV